MYQLLKVNKMIDNFDLKLQEYAQLLIHVGVNIQPGQTLRISGSVDCAQLVRLCVEAAYDAGARQVLVEWTDDFVTRQRYTKAHIDTFSEFPSYLSAMYDYLTENNCPVLSIIGSNPELLKGVASDRIQAWQRTFGKGTEAFYTAMDSGAFQWCIGANPTRAWSAKVFPEKSSEAAIDALWTAVFETCRITGDGLAAARWKTHCDQTSARSQILNQYNFKSLHYTNSLGTNLTVCLPENHVWAGGSDKTFNGIDYIANIPTEEIFTAPHYKGVNGRVYSALPLSLNGNIVENFYLDFENGKIVNLYAERGEEYLRASTQIDEGSSYLGEVALVPYDSPIRNSGILFYNTLFDENASCHLAYGAAYPNCIKGAEQLSESQQTELGLNHSVTHVDFMIGTKDLCITGTTQNGDEIPVFVDGNFAF